MSFEAALFHIMEAMISHGMPEADASLLVRKLLESYLAADSIENSPAKDQRPQMFS